MLSNEKLSCLALCILSRCSVMSQCPQPQEIGHERFGSYTSEMELIPLHGKAVPSCISAEPKALRRQ